MKKRNGFCLLPLFFGLLVFIGIVIIVVFAIIEMYNPTFGNESFEEFERGLIEEYDIDYADVFIDTDAIEVYFSSVERVTLEESREIMELTREYMQYDENYKPFIERFRIENEANGPESVRIRFEPLLTTDFYYQYTGEDFYSTKWVFESNINGYYKRQVYEVFDFVKSFIFDKKYV